MRNFNDRELLERVRGLDTFKYFPDFLEIYVRSQADVYDAFDDKFFSYRRRSGLIPTKDTNEFERITASSEQMEFVGVRNGTTNAGSYGLKHFDEYNHLGCAVAKSDVIVYDSHVFGYHHHIKDSQHEAYIQATGFPYFRDDNRNERAEEIGEEYNDIIGMNIHRAGQDSTVIKNWSVACMVTANLKKYITWLQYLKDAGKPPISLCILKEF